ncbi:MAG: hypothetical protein ACTSPY_00150 [Candidatus Helarchaeota archaeon]
MKPSIKILAVISICLPIIHIILSNIFEFLGFTAYGSVYVLLKLFIFPLALTTLMWYYLSGFIAKKFILILHYLIYRNRKRPKSMYFFTDNEYPVSIGNYIRESLYPTAMFLSILMFILGSDTNIVNEIFSISINIFNTYLITIVILFPILSSILISPVKLIDWCGFRYYNSKRNAVFQVGLKVGTLFNSITGMAVMLSLAFSIFTIGLELSLRVAFSVIFYILPLNILLIIVLNHIIVPNSKDSFKKKVIKDKKYKITPEREYTKIKFESSD